MGRIHRYGQEYEVEVFNLVAATTREGQVLLRLMHKLESMRKDLGHDQVYDVISTVLDSAQVRLDALIRDAILQRRSMEDILGQLDFVEDPAALAAARDALSEALATDHIDLAFISGEERESKERRLTPEYVERFFVDGLAFLGGRTTRNNDQTWTLDLVPAAVRHRVKAANVGEIGSDQRRVTFYKERARRDPPAEFVAPDHPLFDVVLDDVLEKGLPTLRTGTVFLDKEATGPYLVWLLEAAVVNGAGDTVHKRLLALRQRGADDFEPVAPGLLLDLAPERVAPKVSDELKGHADPDAAIRAATITYTAEYLDEVAAEQEHRATIVETALQQSVNDSLSGLQTQLERQHADREKGKDMDIAIRTTNDRIDELTRELQARRTELAQCRVTTISTPRVVGVAAVQPGIVAHVFEHGKLGLGHVDKVAVELAAMQVAQQFEEAHGREVTDTSRMGVGYDLKSVGAEGKVRYIEVKGHAESTLEITLYYTEWQTAHRMREEFFIYDVERALTDPQLTITQDPVGQGIEAQEKTVEYRIKTKDLKTYGQAVSLDGGEEA